MNSQIKRVVLLGASAVIFMGCSAKQVSFKNDVMPIFKENCSACHLEGGQGYLASGFSVESYDTIMKGTKLGPVVVAGMSDASTIQKLLMHKADPNINMPKNAPKLSDDKIKTITTWIDQGAKNN